MLKKLAIIIILCFSTSAFSKYDLRKCLILPVTGTADSNLFPQVYEKVESYLKKVKWCYYKTNSDIFDILQKYKNELDNYLENKEVISTIAEKTKTGALIRIQLNSQEIGIKISFRVIGENGEDIYFKGEKLVPFNNSQEMAQAVAGWLEEYAKVIPFDAKIISLNGSEISADMGYNIGFQEDMHVKIFRPMGKQVHPLLKEVIHWDLRELASAELDEINEERSLGQILELKTGEMVAPDDWIVSGVKKDPLQPSGEKSEKPRYGYVSLALDLDNGQQDITAYGFDNNIKGSMIGGYLKGELWFIDHLWTSLELEGRTGTLESDNYYDSDSETRSFFKFKAGYRFLPSETFFGPQIDLYLGYGIYSYQPEYVSLYGPIDATFSGLIVGIKGSMPFSEKIKAYLEFETLFASASSDQYSGGTAPGFWIFLGGNYYLNPKFSLDLSIGTYNNTFENLVPGEDVVYKDTSIRIGATLYF